jgi:hypothetical protein
MNVFTSLLKEFEGFSIDFAKMPRRPAQQSRKGVIAGLSASQHAHIGSTQYLLREASSAQSYFIISILFNRSRTLHTCRLNQTVLPASEATCVGSLSPVSFVARSESHGGWVLEDRGNHSAPVYGLP